MLRWRSRWSPAIHRSWPTFRRNQKGVSAVEFALVFPVALSLFAGMAEMSHAIDNWRKLTLLARTVADLTSQGDAVNPMPSSTMNDILAASTAVLRPLAGTNAHIVVSALAVDATASILNPRVCSSIATTNATARITGLATDLTIPAGFFQNGSRYVLAEVTMTYMPMIGTSLVNLIGGINGAITLNASFPWPTRGGTTVKGTTTEIILPGGSACP